MIIVEIKHCDSIDKALKVLRYKVIKTKQSQELYSRKEYVKKSVKNRTKKLKAIFLQKKKNL
jgi:small subunit ribosomal protein S21